MYWSKCSANWENNKEEREYASLSHQMGVTRWLSCRHQQRHKHENSLVCDKQTRAGGRNRDTEHSSQMLFKGVTLKPPSVSYRLTVMLSVPLEMEITWVLRSALSCESSLCFLWNQGYFCSFSLFPPVRNNSRLGTNCLLSLLIQTWW